MRFASSGLRPIARAVAAALMVASTHAPAAATEMGIYPRGREFPLVLYSSGSVAWWDFPEEQRYWYPNEIEQVRNYAQWTRRHDPARRPNFMYIPGNYLDTDVRPYVQHLDVIPAAVCTTYLLMPHAWVRWRMESTVNGIHLAGAAIGPDYRGGEKTPVAILEMFYEQWDPAQPPAVMTPAGASHDFWQAIVSGARGIMIFSFFHKRDRPEYEQVWAASRISGPERPGEMLLEGQELPAYGFRVEAGPATTVDFVPHGTTLDPVGFPSVDLLAKRWKQRTYVIAVNSAEAPVAGRITGLEADTTKAEVLFEGDVVDIVDGTIATRFAPLGVHIFKFGGLCAATPPPVV